VDLILWRHAEAEDANGKRDTDRELTKKGRRQAAQMAQWLRPRLSKEWRIVVSPAKRTLQTVEPLAMDYETREEAGLAATARSVLQVVEWPDAKHPTLVVGHQPTLGEVVSVLLKGEEGGMSMKKGAVWWFSTRRRENNEETILKAVLNPDMLDDPETP
jgi:phosphohistidine phosphatase